jgi:hypothetical protein
MSQMGEGGYIEIRSGIRPATPEATTSGTNLLATLKFSLSSFGNFQNGIALSNAIPEANVIYTGTATWFRVYEKQGVVVMDGDVRQTGGGGDIEFDNVDFLAGGVISIAQLSLNLFNNECP